MKKVSICVPCYEMSGRGGEFLASLLWSIKSQTYSNIEVIVSDHSKDDIVKNVSDEFKDLLDIHYYRFEEKRGSIAANLNNAIAKTTGSLVKFLLQDDFFLDNRSLEEEIKNLGDADWGLSATIHWNERILYWHLVPVYTHQIYTGANTIGSPSLLLCKKESCLLFDNNLVNLVDCDYYRMMYDKYGYPKTTQRITTVSRVWDGQHQRSQVDNDMKTREFAYVTNKYKGPSI